MTDLHNEPLTRSQLLARLSEALGVRVADLRPMGASIALVFGDPLRAMKFTRHNLGCRRYVMAALSRMRLADLRYEKDESKDAAWSNGVTRVLIATMGRARR